MAVTVAGLGICAALAGIRVGLASSHTAAVLELSRHFAEEVRQFTLGLEFSDPSGGGIFGPEEGIPSSFDDMDDLDGLVQSPPLRGDGTVMAGHQDWCQRVDVRNIDPVTLVPAGKVLGGSSALLFTVTIEKGGRELGVYRWIMADR